MKVKLFILFLCGFAIHAQAALPTCGSAKTLSSASVSGAKLWIFGDTFLTEQSGSINVWSANNGNYEASQLSFIDTSEKIVLSLEYAAKNFLITRQSRGYAIYRLDLTDRKKPILSTIRRENLSFKMGDSLVSSPLVDIAVTNDKLIFLSDFQITILNKGILNGDALQSVVLPLPLALNPLAPRALALWSNTDDSRFFVLTKTKSAGAKPESTFYLDVLGQKIIKSDSFSSELLDNHYIDLFVSRGSEHAIRWLALDKSVSYRDQKMVLGDYALTVDGLDDGDSFVALLQSQGAVYYAGGLAKCTIDPALKNFSLMRLSTSLGNQDVVLGIDTNGHLVKVTL
jgi:hypothetical protein